MPIIGDPGLNAYQDQMGKEMAIRMNNRTILTNADALARMVCKLGIDEKTWTEERERLLKMANEWLDFYHQTSDFEARVRVGQSK
jgi:hypothetical protein